MLNAVLHKLINQVELSEDEMAEAIGHVMDGHVSPVQMTAFLVALRCKGETAREITGAARAMRHRMNRLQMTRRPLFDTCGTGGDGAGTFNISTTVAFVLAACGVRVAKHGNRAMSSKSGSADVLQALGVNIEAPPAVVERCVETLGLGFLFAPLSHPAMRHAAAVRKELGLRTIFNVLGPLTNPAGAERQLLGVFDRSLLGPMATVLGQLGSERAWVVWGADGLDELTLCERTYVAEWTGNMVREFVITPEEVGLKRAAPESLRGGTPEDNAVILRDLLQGRRHGAMRDAVALNSAAALLIADQVVDMAHGVQRAYDVLQSGAALDILERLLMETRKLA